MKRKNKVDLGPAIVIVIIVVTILAIAAGTGYYERLQDDARNRAFDSIDFSDAMVPVVKAPVVEFVEVEKKPTRVPEVATLDSFRKDILNRMNQERGVPVVAITDLTDRAKVRAAYLCENEFSHDGYILFFAGAPYSWIGENLAEGFDDVGSMHQAWMDSPTHRANIVSGKYQYVGIAYQDCEDNEYGNTSITVVLFAGSSTNN